MKAPSIDIEKLELNALLEVTQAINNNLPEEDLYRIFKFTLLGDLKVAQMALFVEEDGWRCKTFFGSSYDWDNEVLPLNFREIEEDISLEGEEGPFSEFNFCFPVKHKEKLLAVVFLGQGIDVTFVKALSNIIMVAVENKRLARERLNQEAYKRELEIAKKVQNFLFPKTLPNTTRLRVEAVYLPHQDVGGDYYDYIKIDQDRFLICVADVSGKGVPAALLMSNFQATLRALIRKTTEPLILVEELNRATFHSGNAENFITFFIGIYNFKTRSMEFVNCGHNPLFLIRGQEMDELNSGTTVLGMLEPLPFIESSVVEDLHDFTFFGYTDGLTETFNSEGEHFGEDRLKDLLMMYNTDIKYLHNNLLQELDGFRGDTPYHDDITILSCRVKLSK